MSTLRSPGGAHIGARQGEESPAGPLGLARQVNDSGHWDLTAVVGGLRAVRDRWRESQGRTKEFGGREFPSRDALELIVGQLVGALFPMRLGPTDLRQESEDFYVGYKIGRASCRERV